MSKEQPKFTIRPLEAGERIKPWCDFWINNGIPVFAAVAEKCCESHCPHYRVSLGRPRIDPGDGYRLLVDGEVIALTDECWLCGSGPWSCKHGGAGEVFDSRRDAPIRRRVPQPQPQPESAEQGDPAAYEVKELDLPKGWFMKQLESQKTDPAAEAAGVEPGEGWRLLDVGEMVERGDELYYHKSGEWCAGVWTGVRVPEGLTYRRRIPAPESVAKRFGSAGRDVTGLYGLHDESDTVVPVVDLWQHEREEYQKTIDALQERCNWLERDGNTWEFLCKEHESRANLLSEELRIVTLANSISKGNVDSLITERDSLQQQLAEAKEALANWKSTVYEAGLATPAVQEEWREPDERDVNKFNGSNTPVQFSNNEQFREPVTGRLDGILEKGVFCYRFLMHKNKGEYEAYRFARVKKEVNHD